ncbi:hypothetical protein [Marinobacter sp. X15-166B]|uniref:hypothetical protein n=1 Tax=Marinobacter sp. X15-166B TaxID=1897620 RepID=UPI00085C9822|nr:hypothetical protein [Marinobacter sp. X15-166B]OEY67215.1 hypothetical protein BG841_12665 [Marinobacter sp. X15-166B]
MKITATRGVLPLAATLVLSWTGLSAPLAVADEVRVPIMSQADRSALAKLPRSGQSQAAVRQSFGTPQATSGPVGQPPISHWDYPAFVVYFEQDRVIHTVLKPDL